MDDHMQYSNVIRAELLSTDEICARASNLVSPLIKKISLRMAISGIWTFDFLVSELIPKAVRPQMEHGVALGSIGEEKVFGLFDPLRNVVALDASLEQGAFCHRRPFVLFHEVFGHALLQGEYLRDQIAAAYDCKLPADTKLTLSDFTRNQLERQANIFAMEIAAPKRLVQAALCKYYTQAERHRMIYKGPGTYDIRGRVEIDHIDEYCRQLARPIQHAFGGLSLQALSYRIKTSGFVRDMPAMRSSGFKLFLKGGRRSA